MRVLRTHLLIRSAPAGIPEIPLLRTPKNVTRECDNGSPKRSAKHNLTVWSMHPGAVAGAVVALQQTVDERATAALDQRVRVAQLQEPAPEPAACEGAGAAAHLLQRDA